ncbi:hypothetical protein PHET_09668 [Paragonimus heterotremus]|uniref:Reverse transcriptase domain-containing protein n=1 Tax=Paragonimus heterotremus TaxID=100268 RepID=A0A8J4SGK4_9TREM|nr:hypothetical protein PHET_09668 [Paragonimus heterotremus]
MLTYVPGAAAYLQDIVAIDHNAEDSGQKLDQTFTRLSEYGLRLRTDKYNFRMSSYKCLGIVVDKDDRRPDSANVASTERALPPTDLQIRRSFLRLVSHYGFFLPELHRIQTIYERMMPGGSGPQNVSNLLIVTKPC